MTDFVLKIRLEIDDSRKNKELISKFTEWLNQEYPKPAYKDHAVKFLENVLESAQIPFDGLMTTDISHNAENDYLDDLRHPKLAKGRVWFVDDLQLKNKSVIWIKLENQWIKGKVEIKNKNSSIIIEPENVVLPITESLFLRW